MREHYHLVKLCQYRLVLYSAVKQTIPMVDDTDMVVEGRRRLLREWINSRYAGVQAAFIQETGINQGELSGLLKTKSFGERRARKLEEQAGMPRFYLDRARDDATTPDTEVGALQRQIESLTVVLASLVAITAKHRPLEAEEIARLIRENQSLDLAHHDLAADILDLIGPAKAGSAKPAVRARKRSAS
ncbi:hypothetical protein [Rhodanobacter fulvus]|nr:hypothetical protein [Rhodanobacter fulvus]